MSRTLAVLGALVASLPFTASLAEPLGGAQIRSVAMGGEFRGFIQTQRGFENHIWRFAPDGRASATANYKRSPGNLGFMQEFGDAGSWHVDGDRLCVDWQGLNRQFSGCYAVDGIPNSNQVRLTGPAIWQGTLDR
jgi:hypothetical protein